MIYRDINSHRDEIILQEKDGNVIYLDDFGHKNKGRKKISCKCGHKIDTVGAIKKKRYAVCHFLLQCKKCKRWNSP